MQNNLVELWGLLHWLYPALFTPPTQRRFAESFSLARGTYDHAFLGATERLLGKIMLRRTKDTVSIAVPPREEHTLFVPMSEAQRFWTFRMLTKLETVDLQDIFTIKLEEEKENAGRKEVQAIIAAHNAQAEGAQTGGTSAYCYSSVTYCAYTRRRVEAAYEPVAAAAQDL